jgi:hypothetical protein
MKIVDIVVAEVPCRKTRNKFNNQIPMNFERMEAHLSQLEVTISERFRFISMDQLRRLLNGFHFPRGKIKCKTYVFEAEEILLIGLTKLCFPLRWSDMYERFPGRKRWHLQAAFYWFLDFMIFNWVYFLVNNMEWWKPYLVESAEAMRIKLANLPFANWRQFHPSVYQDPQNGFKIGLVIDNTMKAFCRPGGNLRGGVSSPRVPLEVQQAWWTGWKKLHGMKWQTVSTAFGMEFNVWGPMSCRRNDNTTLNKSKIEQKLEDLQLNDIIKIFMYGDSAYSDSDFLKTGLGRGLSAIRECVEWEYKDLKTMWKYLDYSHVLQGSVSIINYNYIINNDYYIYI